LGRSIANITRHRWSAAERRPSPPNFDTNETDLFSYITNVKRAEPDAIMMAANTQNAITLTEQLRQMSIKSKPVRGRILLPRSHTTTQSQEGRRHRRPDGLCAELRQSGEQDLRGDVQGGLRRGTQQQRRRGFEELTILTNAIKKAGKAEPEAIRDAIASSTTDGPSGEIKFNDKGQGYGFTVFLTRKRECQAHRQATAQIAKRTEKLVSDHRPWISSRNMFSTGSSSDAATP